MQFTQDMTTEIEQAYCDEGLTQYQIADKFLVKRDQIKFLILKYGWVRSAQAVAEKIKRRRLKKINTYHDHGVKPPSQEWPEDARFDRPGMTVSHEWL